MVISSGMKLTVLMPAYNEAENVRRIPTELLPYLNELGLEYEIILIDDGSKDETSMVAESLGIPELRLIRQSPNQGVGAAIRVGIKAATGDLLVMLDTDLTFHPKYIKDLLDRFNQGDVDFVVGSPKLAGLGKDIEWYRRVITRVANLFYPLLFGRQMTSITPIFRLYKTAQLKELELFSKTFEITVEILFKLVMAGRTSAEVPTPLTARIYGVSKLNYWKEMQKHLKLMVKILRWRLVNIFK